MENYICINGKKAELTEEQLKALGIELPKANPFERAERHTPYYAIDTAGVVRKCSERNDGVDNAFYNIANYCTDKAIMEQRALHETLNRLLWRYAMEHGGTGIFEIAYDGIKDKFTVQNCLLTYTGETFCKREVAENAIEDIIKPFMKAHPHFKF